MGTVTAARGQGHVQGGCHSSLRFVSGNASEVLKEWTVTGKKKVTLSKTSSLGHFFLYPEGLDRGERQVPPELGQREPKSSRGPQWCTQIITR